METSTLISLLGSVVTIAIAGVGAAYTYGRLDSRLESLGKTVEEGFGELKASRDKAHHRIGHAEQMIVRLETEVFRETTQRYALPRRRNQESDGDE